MSDFYIIQWKVIDYTKYNPYRTGITGQMIRITVYLTVTKNVKTRQNTRIEPDGRNGLGIAVTVPVGMQPPTGD